MGAEVQPVDDRRVEVLISGFGSFHGVPSNPTSRLVGWLAGTGAGGGGGGGAGADDAPRPRALRHGRIASCTILKASARAVNEYLIRQLEDLKRRGAQGGAPAVVLLLHFGADTAVSARAASARGAAARGARRRRARAAAEGCGGAVGSLTLASPAHRPAGGLPA
jgi:hypothetical protein